MPESRQLAIIMFTDIVDYTAMMQYDEPLALLKLHHYKNTLKQQVAQFHGEIIQYFGDGGLVIFSNSADAVNCSASLQKEFQEYPKVPVRIGLHLGDILIKEGNIFGNSVNVTSRIESMGTAGSVLLSELIQKELRNKPDFRFVSLGKYEFKNVEDPMEIFALESDHLSIPDKNSLIGKFKQQQRIVSVAVLSFVNMSNDPEQEYFGDGIAEEIINSLVHIKELNVAGRTSSFQFKGKNVDLREVGEKLSVQHVVEGSVRKHANRIRITAQLINVADGYHLWSERYDREMNDVFEIQDEIALAITDQLKITLLKKDRDLITKSPTQNAEAYELYLKGRFYLERRGASLLTSMQCFQKAIQLDPDFALAYAASADLNLLLGIYGFLPPKKVMPVAKQYAEKALQLDPTLYQPYCTLGYYYVAFEWDWAASQQYFLKCIELNPRYAEGHFWYGLHYLASIEGNFEEAEQHALIAAGLEPLSSICLANYSIILHNAGKFREALDVCNTGIEIDPDSFLCYINAGRAHMALRQYDEAFECFSATMKLTKRSSFTYNALIWLNCLRTDFDTARKLMAELQEKSQREYIPKTYTAFSAAYLGDVDEAMDYMEKAYEERDPMLVMLKYEYWIPQLLKEDARFQALLSRMNFPD